MKRKIERKKKELKKVIKHTLSYSNITFFYNGISHLKKIVYIFTKKGKLSATF